MSTQAISRISAMSQTTQSNWLTANEAAQYLKIKPRTLLQWARERRIPAHRLSGIRRCVWRFLMPELDAMLGLSSAVPAEGRQQ
jgi:excisionase family DNA binding protein